MTADRQPRGGIRDDTRAVCVGSGRFLRAVLVPVLQRAGGGGVALFQPRGEGFADACQAAGLRYDVDTSHRDGRVTTETLQLAGVGSLAREADRQRFLRLPETLPALRFVGVGITDAGFVQGSAALRDLAQFLFACYTHRPDNVLSVLNTDNVPTNGDLLRERVLEAAWPDRPSPDSAAWAAFVAYVDAKVHFHNTMVDRLTSHRPGDPLVPLAEPWPAKVLAIQDAHGVLDAHWRLPGVVVRATREELLRDQKLKLRIANATSSALVYVLALSRFHTNNEARLLPSVLAYRDALFCHDVLPSLEHEGVPRAMARQVYDEWTHRSAHAHFGLVNLWVTQNAWLHFAARLFPSIVANVTLDERYRVSPWMAFATASILRFLTPLGPQCADGRTVFLGAMDKRTPTTPVYPELSGDWVYGGGLRANFTTGVYEFVDAPQTDVAARLAVAAAALKDTNESIDDADVLRPLVAELLSSVVGFDLKREAFAQFATDVAALYARLMRGALTGTPSSLDVLSALTASRRDSAA